MDAEATLRAVCGHELTNVVAPGFVDLEASDFVLVTNAFFLEFRDALVLRVLAVDDSLNIESVSQVGPTFECTDDVTFSTCSVSSLVFLSDLGDHSVERVVLHHRLAGIAVLEMCLRSGQTVVFGVGAIGGVRVGGSDLRAMLLGREGDSIVRQTVVV